MVLLTLALVLAVALLGVVAAGAVLAAFGALSGTELRRCERCHRLGFAARGPVHAEGCPPPVLHAPFAEARSALAQRRFAPASRHGGQHGLVH